MAQVITRCRLTGHYMFMGLDVDPKEFTRSPGPFKRKFCPFCACDHLWHKEDSKFLAPKPPSRLGIQQADGDIGRPFDAGLRRRRLAPTICRRRPSPNEMS
jgi:hypothetical protein